MSPNDPAEKTRGVVAWLRGVLLALVEYIPLLLTIGLATYVGLTTTDPNTKQGTLLQWVIVLLGLLGTSLLVERVAHLKRIDRKVADIADLFSAFMSERIRATDFFLDDLPDLRRDVEAASNIMVVAVNAEAFLVEYKNAIADRVREGAELRVIAVDASNAVATQIANPEKELTVEYMQATAKIAKQTLMWIDRERKGSGSVELRYCDHVPMFAAYAFDRMSPRGKIVIGLYRQFWTHERRPHAILTKAHDAYWYTFYCDQIEEIWKRGKPISLAATPPSL